MSEGQRTAILQAFSAQGFKINAGLVFLLQSAAATNVRLSLSTSTTDGLNYALQK